MSTIDYLTAPLESLSFKDLSDAFGIGETAKLFDTTDRGVYTQRNTNSVSVARMQKLLGEIRKDEAHYRERLVIMRNKQELKQTNKARAAA